MRGLLIIMCFSLAAHAKLPPKAQTLLDSLPGKALTLDLVVSRAVDASDSFKAVASQKINVVTPELQARAALDTLVTLKGSFLNNENEPTNNFQPNLNRSSTLSLGVATRFLTGTQLSAEVSHGHTRLGFIAIPGFGDPSNQFYSSNAKIALSQSLWKNAFGEATRSLVESGIEQSRYAQFSFDESVEQWVLQLMDLYYEAWFAKARARASQAGVERQRRLARITRLKQRRGTAEKPDVIQVESNFAQSEIDAANAHEALKSLWRDLVLSLKLPAAWLDLDPMLIPITLPDSVPNTLAQCKEGAPTTSTAVKKALALAKASQAAEDRAASQANPDLTLALELNGNGIDGGGGAAASEAIALDHPAWGATLTLSVPLGFRAEEAAYRSARAEALRAEALATDAKSRLQVQWVNECSRLRQLLRNTEVLEKTLKSQLQRTRLEQRRFEVGRSSVLQSIQADADATASELALRTSQKDLHLSAWRVRRLSGALKSYFEKLLANPPKMGAVLKPARWAHGSSNKDRS